MIFGFNTDIKHDETVYHVQSEARVAEHLLQTQVFVRGRCIGKRAVSYAEHLQQPGFSDDCMHELLKAQHRSAIEAIRNEHLGEFLGAGYEAAEPTEEPVLPRSPSPLELDFVNASDFRRNGGFLLKVRLLDAGATVSGAKVVSKVTSADLAQPVYGQAFTGDDGIGEIAIGVANPASNLTVLVQSTHDGRTATRKLILRSSKQ